MSQEEVMDVIVVGAGLAGLACANEVAAAGLQVIVLERGDVAGSKNLSGGRLYLEPVRACCSGLIDGAPFERPVTSETIALCDDHSSVSLRFDAPPAEGPPRSVTVLRARLDAHLADRVSERGGMILPQQRVDGLLREGGKVVGVRVGPEELRARVVVAADGALSFLAEEAGLRPARDPSRYALGVKEVIHLEPATIEDRFNLAEGQGAARLYLGRVTRGLPGGGFIYTNRDSLSIGLVGHLRAMQPGKLEDGFAALLEPFKRRADVAPLLAGGKSVEYGAHLLPEGGYRALPEPGLPGLLLVGDAAGLVLNTGAVLRGMDLALASGAISGRAIVQSLQSGSGPGVCLSRYRADLEQSFVMTQLRTHRKAARLLDLERLYDRYPSRLVRWFAELFEVGASGRHTRMREASRRLRRDVLGLTGLRDLWRLMRM